MRVLYLFSGAGSHLTGDILGWTSVGSVESDPACHSVLIKHFPKEVISNDVKTFTAYHLKGKIEGIAGGFPCQDISSAGKGKGIKGNRSGLWCHFARIIGEAQPAWAFIENSPLLRTRGLKKVLSDLDRIGYDAEWCCLRASDVGAPHQRKRMFILAYSKGLHSSSSSSSDHRISNSSQASTELRNSDRKIVADYLRVGRSGHSSSSSIGEVRPWREGCAEAVFKQDPRSEGCCFPKPLICRMDDGVANRMDRIRMIGNGWVPVQAAAAFKILRNRIIL